MSRIFISYSRRDLDFARRLATDLERAGADVWLDTSDIPAGTDWADTIQRGLDAADLMVLIVSPDSMASGNVSDEWKYFRNQLGRPIIPIWHKPADLHFQLNKYQHVDFNSQPYEVALAALKAELTRRGFWGQADPAATLTHGSPRPSVAATPVPPRKKSPVGWIIGGLLGLMLVCGVVALIAANAVGLLPGSDPPRTLPTGAALETNTPARETPDTDTPASPPEPGDPTEEPTPTLMPEVPTDTPMPTFTPSPTPTGGGLGKIAFASDRDGDFEIYVLDVTSGSVTKITSDPADDGAPAWSPDGKQITFVSDRSGTNDLYVMDADGGNQRRLTSLSGSEVGPAWSPDGGQIAFQYVADGKADIYVMDANGSNVTQLTDDPAWDSGPSWYPDGIRIAFSSNRGDGTNIWVINPGGLTARTGSAKNDVGINMARVWPYAAYYSQHGDYYDIFVEDFANGGITRIASSGGNHMEPSWSPDAEWIVYHGDGDGDLDWDIYMVNVSTGEVVLLSATSSLDMNPDWSP